MFKSYEIQTFSLKPPSLFFNIVQDIIQKILSIPNKLYALFSNNPAPLPDEIKPHQETTSLPESNFERLESRRQKRDDIANLVDMPERKKPENVFPTHEKETAKPAEKASSDPTISQSSHHL